MDHRTRDIEEIDNMTDETRGECPACADVLDESAHRRCLASAKHRRFCTSADGGR